MSIDYSTAIQCSRSSRWQTFRMSCKFCREFRRKLSYCRSDFSIDFCDVKIIIKSWEFWRCKNFRGTIVRSICRGCKVVGKVSTYCEAKWIYPNHHKLHCDVFRELHQPFPWHPQPINHDHAGSHIRAFCRRRRCLAPTDTRIDSTRCSTWSITCAGRSSEGVTGNWWSTRTFRRTIKKLSFHNEKSVADWIHRFNDSR